MTDTAKPDRGLNNDPATDRRLADAPEAFNESQDDEQSQAQTVAADAIAAGAGSEASDEQAERGYGGRERAQDEEE